MPSLKNLLTNGWSGWIRVGILLSCFIWYAASFRSEIVTELKHLRLDFEKHEECSAELVAEFRIEMKSLSKLVYSHMGGKRW